MVIASKLTMDNATDRQQLDSLIQRFDVAMLVTLSRDGLPRARPMAIAEHRPVGALYFFTRGDDEKFQEILQASRVCITMQDDGVYLSITGEARIETDQTRIDELWSASQRLWFPDGVTDPTLILLAVEPVFAELWNRSGPHGIEFLWKAGKSLLRGEKLDDAALTGHAKLRLD